MDLVSHALLSRSLTYCEVFGSMTFDVFFGVLTVYSTIWVDQYGYNNVEIGLRYLYASLSIWVERGHH